MLPIRTLPSMNLARGLEQRLENLVDGVSASVFRGQMHPVTMASKLVRQLEFLSFEGPAGIAVPNDLTIVVHPADLDPGIDVDALEAELADVAFNAAAEYGWRAVGPFDIHFETSHSVPRGILQAAGDPVAGRLEPWGQLIAVDGSAVVPLSMNRTLIGRALECDVRFSNYEVSRHHAIVVWRTEQATITDLGSSNGTMLNGDRLGAKPAQLLPGTVVSFGNLGFTYRMVA